MQESLGTLLMWESNYVTQIENKTASRDLETVVKSSGKNEQHGNAYSYNAACFILVPAQDGHFF